MTALAERIRPKSGGAFVPGPPQVNLLPPEIKAARGLRATKRLLALTLLLVVVLCAGAWLRAFLDKGAAQDDLTTAQEETARLQTEMQQYSKVPLVLGQLQNATTARALGMSTEILWQPYIAAIAAVLPPNVSFDSITVTQATPMTGGASVATPLQEPSIGQLSFSARTTTIPDSAAWIDALNSIPGLGDAWVSSATITQDAETETVYYAVAATVQIRESALAQRFAQTDEPSGDQTTSPTEEGN